MVSLHLYPTLSCLSTSPSKHQIDLPDELKFVNICQGGCYLTMHLRYWLGAEPSHFYSKSMIVNLESFKSTNTAASYPFMPKLFLKKDP